MRQTLDDQVPHASEQCRGHHEGADRDLQPRLGDQTVDRAGEPLRARQHRLNRPDTAQPVGGAFEVTRLEQLAGDLRCGQPAEEPRLLAALGPHHERVVRAEDDAQYQNERQRGRSACCLAYPTTLTCSNMSAGR